MSDHVRTGQLGTGWDPLCIGAEGGRITIGHLGKYWKLGPRQAEDFAQHFVRACWEAARQAEGMTDAQRAELTAAAEEITLATPGQDTP